jgi:hypothetical protein
LPLRSERAAARNESLAEPPLIYAVNHRGRNPRRR